MPPTTAVAGGFADAPYHRRLLADLQGLAADIDVGS